MVFNTFVEAVMVVMTFLAVADSHARPLLPAALMIQEGC
jgi:hypothetical protein